MQDLTSGNNERNALREKITNEQVQDNGSENVVLNNIEPNNTNNTGQENVEWDTNNKDNSVFQLTNDQNSFIWNY